MQFRSIAAALLTFTACGSAPSADQCKSMFATDVAFVNGSTTQAQVEAQMGAEDTVSCDKINGEGQNPPLPCGTNSTTLTYLVDNGACGTITYILTGGVVSNIVEYERYNDGTWATLSP